MNIRLSLYHSDYNKETLIRISKFFSHHSPLVKFVKKDFNEDHEATKTLPEWLGTGHKLYIILADNTSVGFVHIRLRGHNVAWIEDIFVDEDFRSKGIGTKSIQLSEEIIKCKCTIYVHLHGGGTSQCCSNAPLSKAWV
ncbi:MAG: GNAT family N-acetyltransferase [Oscillospiraceae bacterium]